MTDKTAIFIEKAREVHGEKYDYSKVKYINSGAKVIIICKIHGDFEQTPNSHLNSTCCKLCGIIKRKDKLSSNTEEFILKSKEVHGEKYDYSKVKYKNAQTNIIIICKNHGVFEQIPNSHLSGNGCKLCGFINIKKKLSSNREDFIEKAISIHGEKYDYSKVIYNNSQEKVIIICKIHGEFEQIPSSHLRGNNCKLCGIEKKFSNTEDFILKATEVHGEKYDYSKVIYINSREKVIIICKIHGEFEQTPNGHLSGQCCNLCKCKNYSKMQIKWLDFLSKYYNIHIQHAENGGEFSIPKTRYKADGFCQETNTIYEFHGSYWHGDPKIYDPTELNEVSKCSYGELYERTKNKEECIVNLGFNLIVIWEREWNKLNNSIRILQKQYRTAR